MVELIPSFNACLVSGLSASADTALRLLIGAMLMLMLRWSGGRRFFPGQALFTTLQLAMLWWLLASGIEQMSSSGECRLALALVSWPAIAAVAPLWALFLRQYVRSDYRPLSWTSRCVVLVPVTVMSLVALANSQLHWLYRPDSWLDYTPTGLFMRYERGTAAYVAAGYSYLCAVASIVMVLRWAWRAGDHRRRYVGSFVTMTVLPWSVNIAYLAGGLTFFGADPTPLSFGVAMFCFAVLIRNSPLFRLVPTARRVLVDELPDPVLILDSDNRVMEANPAAHRLAGLRQEWFARPLPSWPVFGAALVERLGTPDTGALLHFGEPGRYFELRMRRIEHGHRDIGRLLQLCDVTEHQLAKDRAQATLAERNAQLEHYSLQHDQLREQALRDPLTGLYNRRALFEIFASEAERMPVPPRPMALALLDIDHFKHINDTHGHGVGDEVLRTLAQALSGRLRSSDTLFRIGGEEFLLLMPGADAAIAERRLQALRGHLADHPIATSAGPLKITWSAGVAEWPVCGPTLDSLLDAADQALYRAKADGRDRVVRAQAASVAAAPPLEEERGLR